ncbi:FixH family protein [Polaromonas jejuensis]|uniref:FixH family protein n=1 Tax=Polaromonas jejuensis TaxID=457502 RepID=A0ABW0Q803_9BURK|nr:FixH family protein [Polaromonas jejuensis]
MNPVNKTARHVSRISTAPPWWKEPYVWLVIAGPLSAVLACAVTAVYIMQGPEALVSDDAYREGIAISQKVQTARPPMQPALTGRNHSATGGKRDEQP